MHPGAGFHSPEGEICAIIESLPCQAHCISSRCAYVANLQLVTTLLDRAVVDVLYPLNKGSEPSAAPTLCFKM